MTDISQQAGIKGPMDGNGHWVMHATSAAMAFDYDKDGCLDLFVASRNNAHSEHLLGNLGWRDSLFHNNCDGTGTFTDVSVAAGLDDTGSSMTPAIGDFDGDGWPDIFVPHWDSNGSLGFQFYRNQHDGTFRKIYVDPNSINYGTQAGWAAGVADFNNDGLLDIMVWGKPFGSDPDTHVLLINNGNWTFTNEAESSGITGAGVTAPYVMGCMIGDVDNDGYPDLIMGNGAPTFGAEDSLWLNQYATNGYLSFTDMSSLIDFPAPYDPNCHSPSKLDNTGFITDNLKQFFTSAMECDMPSNYIPAQTEKPTDLCKAPYPYRGHGILLWDYDQDGDLDIFMSKGGPAAMTDTVAPNRMFRNDGGNANNWLYLNLTGTLSNRDAIGSRIQVVASQNGANQRSIYMDALSNSNFESSGPHEIHFGLGSDTTVDQVIVNWPSGIQTVMNGVGINQRLSITENTLTSSNFNNGQATGWTPLSGTWSVQNGVYQQNSTVLSSSVNGSYVSSDYTVVGKLTYLSGSGQISLMGRTDATAHNGYGVQIQGTQAQLFKVVNGSKTFLGNTVTIDPMTPNRSYIVALNMTGTHLTMRVDGQIATVTDSSIAKGGLALVTNGVTASFDNIAAY
jgi:hypothetical protein